MDLTFFALLKEWGPRLAPLGGLILLLSSVLAAPRIFLRVISLPTRRALGVRPGLGATVYRVEIASGEREWLDGRFRIRIQARTRRNAFVWRSVVARASRFRPGVIRFTQNAPDSVDINGSAPLPLPPRSRSSEIWLAIDGLRPMETVALSFVTDGTEGVCDVTVERLGQDSTWLVVAEWSGTVVRYRGRLSERAIVASAAMLGLASYLIPVWSGFRPAWLTGSRQDQFEPSIDVPVLVAVAALLVASGLLLYGTQRGVPRRGWYNSGI